MSEQTAQEPTMEEILASIRRIISEDDAPAAAAPQAAAAPAPAAAPVHATPALMDESPAMEEEDEEVLELTQRWEEPAPVPRPTPVETLAPTPFPSPVQSLGDLDVAPRPEPAYEAEAPVFHHAEPHEETVLVSDRTADSAAAAFGALAQTLLMPREGRSLEDVVKELMKPMLREWLDQNLPTIVEAQVRSEVERIARRGAR